MAEHVNSMYRDKQDSRYTVSLEWTGEPERRHVVRFCGEWVACAFTLYGAMDLVKRHKAERDRVLSYDI